MTPTRITLKLLNVEGKSNRIYRVVETTSKIIQKGDLFNQRQLDCFKSCGFEMNVTNMPDKPNSKRNSTMAKKKAKKKVSKKKTTKKAAAVKPESANKGRTLGMSVRGTWISLFEKNESLPKNKKLTDKDIHVFMNKEFPGRTSGDFQEVRGVARVRTAYNRGIFTKGEIPKTESFAYDDSGSKVLGKSQSEPKVVSKKVTKKKGKKKKGSKKKSKVSK